MKVTDSSFVNTMITYPIFTVLCFGFILSGSAEARKLGPFLSRPVVAVYLVGNERPVQLTL